MMAEKMRKPYTILVLLLSMASMFVCSSKVSTRKIREAGHSVTDGFFCGDEILPIYESLCINRRKRRSPVLSGAEARNFIQKRSASYDRQYHIVEECCQESCAFEEVREYC